MPDTSHTVVRDVIADVAPGELPMADGLARLESGPSPAASAPVRSASRSVSAWASSPSWPRPWCGSWSNTPPRSATETALDRGGSWLGSLLRRRRGKTAVPHLTPEQLKAVHRAALDEATRRGMPGDEIPAAQCTTRAIEEISVSCNDLVALEGEARDYFRVPERSLQALWQDFLDVVEDNAPACTPKVADVIRAGKPWDDYSAAVTVLRGKSLEDPPAFIQAVGRVL